MSNKLEDHFKSLEFNLGMVRYADAKLAALVVFFLWECNFLLNELLASYGQSVECLDVIVYWLISLFTIVFLGGGLFNLVKGLWPKIKFENIPETNLFCTHIQKKSFEQFRNEILSESFDYKEDVINQIYINSIIATEKLKRLNISIVFSLLALVNILIVKLVC